MLSIGVLYLGLLRGMVATLSIDIHHASAPCAQVAWSVRTLDLQAHRSPPQYACYAEHRYLPRSAFITLVGAMLSIKMFQAQRTLLSMLHMRPHLCECL
jgi:hypothetical protein